MPLRLETTASVIDSVRDAWLLVLAQTHRASMLNISTQRAAALLMSFCRPPASVVVNMARAPRRSLREVATRSDSIRTPRIVWFVSRQRLRQITFVGPTGVVALDPTVTIPAQQFRKVLRICQQDARRDSAARLAYPCNRQTLADLTLFLALLIGGGFRTGVLGPAYTEMADHCAASFQVIALLFTGS